MCVLPPHEAIREGKKLIQRLAQSISPQRLCVRGLEAGVGAQAGNKCGKVTKNSHTHMQALMVNALHGKLCKAGYTYCMSYHVDGT